VITEQPYSPISREVLEQVQASLARVSVLIICPMPIGSGNLALLQEALLAALHGLLVIILAPPNVEGVAGKSISITNELLQRTGIAERDYTSGQGLHLMEQLLQMGATVVESVIEAIETVRQAGLSW